MPKEQNRKPGFTSATGGSGKGRISAGRKPSADLPGEEQPDRPETVGRPVRGRWFYRFVRNRAAAQLARDYDYDLQSAKDLVDGLEDSEIDAEASKINGLDPVGALGDGSFLKWLQDHSDQIMQLIAAIVKIFAMFGGKGGQKAAAKRTDADADDEDEPAKE